MDSKDLKNVKDLSSEILYIRACAVDYFRAFEEGWAIKCGAQPLIQQAKKDAIKQASEMGYPSWDTSKEDWKVYEHTMYILKLIIYDEYWEHPREPIDFGEWEDYEHIKVKRR